MGQRGEVYSTRIFVDEGNKTFFFNVKENRYHDLYLNIVESRKTDQGFKRSSIVVFREDIDKFIEAYEVSADLFRGRRGQSEKVLSVGEGRRSYTFRIVERRTSTFEIIELREDATGRRRESVQLHPDDIDAFEEGFDKAVSVMKNPR